jgi:hypothetical protein
MKATYFVARKDILLYVLVHASQIFLRTITTLVSQTPPYDGQVQKVCTYVQNQLPYRASGQWE